jgi:FixJ family two-component response regulator
MTKNTPRIFIVDDDKKFNKSLARLVKSIGFDAESFFSANEFLEREPYEDISCLLLDVRMPGLTGPALQEELSKRNISLPIVFLTAHGDVPTSVDAMKGGAVDFLLKPVEEKKLFDAIDKALDRDAQIRKKQEELKEIHGRLSKLTPREYEVFQWIITGMLNKQIAWALGTSERTIKAHRAQIMHKLDVVSVAELVRLAEKAGISPAKDNPTP